MQLLNRLYFCPQSDLVNLILLQPSVSGFLGIISLKKRKNKLEKGLQFLDV